MVCWWKRGVISEFSALRRDLIRNVGDNFSGVSIEGKQDWTASASIVVAEEIISLRFQAQMTHVKARLGSFSRIASYVESCQVIVAADLSDHLLENTVHRELQFGRFGPLCFVTRQVIPAKQIFAASKHLLLALPGFDLAHPNQDSRNRRYDTRHHCRTSRAVSLQRAIIESVQEFQQPPTHASYTRFTSSSLQSTSRPPPISSGDKAITSELLLRERKVYEASRTPRVQHDLSPKTETISNCPSFS